MIIIKADMTWQPKYVMVRESDCVGLPIQWRLSRCPTQDGGGRGISVSGKTPALIDLGKDSA